MRKSWDGVILAGYSCPGCIERALDFLEAVLYIDKEVSVSGLEPEPEALTARR